MFINVYFESEITSPAACCGMLLLADSTDLSKPVIQMRINQCQNLIKPDIQNQITRRPNMTKYDILQGSHPIIANITKPCSIRT